MEEINAYFFKFEESVDTRHYSESSLTFITVKNPIIYDKLILGL
jgi:hypothetical protein